MSTGKDNHFSNSALKIAMTAVISLVLHSISSATPLDTVLLKNAAARKAALFSQIDLAERESRFAEADSLYKALDRAGALNGQHLLRWARTKEVLGGYAALAGICCRVAVIDTRMLDIARSLLAQALENAPGDSIVQALGVFQQCVFGVRGVDSLRMVLWFADFYSRHGMDGEELRVLKHAPGSGSRLVYRLLDLAREQFGRGHVEKSILPARIAWERSQDQREKKDAALLICRAFRSLYRNDSALVWLSRTDIAGDYARIEAVSLYQSCRRLAEAGKIIGLLAPSFVRDTLEVRQRLFDGDTKGAAELAGKLAKSKSWIDQPMESLRWKMRTLIFNGQTDELSSVFDSQDARSSWNDEREYVACRLMFQQFSREPQALSGWYRLEFGIFTGNRPPVSEIVGKSLSGETATLLLLRIVKDMIAKGEKDAALVIFRDKGLFSDAPEYRYLYAETLSGVGDGAHAREILAGIIEDSPSDIYSEKARVLLRNIQGR